MKKSIIRTILVILMIAMFVSTFAITAEARASYYISRTSAYAAASGNGNVTVTFSITGTGPMTEIGATKVVIMNSAGTTLKTYYNTDPGYSAMMSSNKTAYASSITYPGTAGTTYYAVVYFKASNSTGGDTDTYTTSTVKAT